MKQSWFTENQTVSILNEADAGVMVKDICRKYGISNATYYKWKSKYGGLSVSDLKSLRELETESCRMKKMYADLSLENDALKDLIIKNSDATEAPGRSVVPGGGEDPATDWQTPRGTGRERRDRDSSIRRGGFSMNHFTFGLVLAVFIAVLAVPSAAAEEDSYTFAVICDTRSDMDGTGVNESAVRAVCRDLRARGAEFVLAPGDIFCGNIPDSFFTPHTPPLDSMYQSFIDAIEAEGVGLPGSEAEIVLYPTRGNHECYHFTMTEEEVEEAWLRNIGRMVPANGPEYEVGFTYSFLYEGDLFMGLEMYLHSDSMMKTGIRVNQEWIDQTLAENPDADRVFVFGHTPVFSACQRDCLEENPTARDAFLRSIHDRCGVYLCGHDHFYARARGPVYAEDGSTITGWIQQVITPSGAPFMTGARPDNSKWNGVYEDENVIPETYIDNAMGYLLITVDDNRVTVEFIGTQDGATWTRDAQGVYHYTYNTDWERWNFAVLDLFVLERK